MSRSTEWTLTAVIRPVLTVRKTVIDVGSHSVLARIPPQVVEVEAESLVQGVRCESSAHWAAQVKRERIRGSRSRFTVTLSPVGDLSARTIADKLTITPIDQTGKALPGKQIRLVGEVLPDVVATPRSVHVGRRQVGTTVTEWVRVHSLTGSPLTVTRVEAGQGLSALRGEVRRSSQLFRLDLQIRSVGEHSVPLSFEVGDGGSDKYTVQVVIRYEGHEG